MSRPGSTSFPITAIKIETSLEGIEHLSKEKKEEKERKMKEKNHY